MKRDSAFIVSVAAILVILPVLGETDNRLSMSLFATAAMLLALLAVDRQLNRKSATALNADAGVPATQGH